MSSPSTFEDYIQTDACDLYVRRSGSGPTVLFFNGSGASIASTQFLLDQLAESLDLIVLDQRGLGKSTIPPTPWTMADYARDAKHVLEYFDIDQCGVMGMSFGGMVALEFAVTFPEVISRLCLWCTSAGGSAGSSYPLHTLGDKDPDERRRISRMLTDERFTDEWLEEHPIEKSLMTFIEHADLEPVSPERQVGLDAQLSARSGHDVADRLGFVTAPTFIGCGRFDGLAPLENSQALHKRIENSTLKVYEGGHMFVVQDKEALPDATSFLTL
ncbi:MAG: alpha/beta fold hydrolase [Actinobacteria bacterium]|uniref:Unannotated protein n=1 Tax=freshwater metagenome TaxID=449393 RepID=A0A6J7D5N3_9ZZZZ|nr:alpha/beta fold hydrolase [Actinomycetota bacterium]MSX09291.1 alpha/beta fold hydrolase [Actinomycetota bacterium]MSX67730.1 alpha/beta fold hydrolase [Actinomycetota bacterium]